MPTNDETTTDATPNPFLGVVEQVWTQRESVAEIRKGYADARKANDDRYTDESTALNEASNLVQKQYEEARQDIRTRRDAVSKAHEAANKAALEAARAQLPDGYELNEWDY